MMMMIMMCGNADGRWNSGSLYNIRSHHGTTVYLYILYVFMFVMLFICTTILFNTKANLVTYLFHYASRHPFLDLFMVETTREQYQHSIRHLLYPIITDDHCRPKYFAMNHAFKHRFSSKTKRTIQHLSQRY